MNNYKCPICGKDFNKPWMVVNHIRVTKGKNHGDWGEFPEDKEVMELVKKYSTKKIEDDKDLDIDKSNTDNDTDLDNKDDDKNIQKVKPPERKIIKTNKCPDCGADKQQWVSVKTANQFGYELSDDEFKEYDFICSECNELIKVK